MRTPEQRGIIVTQNEGLADVLLPTHHALPHTTPCNSPDSTTTTHSICVKTACRGYKQQYGCIFKKHLVQYCCTGGTHQYDCTFSISHSVHGGASSAPCPAVTDPPTNTMLVASPVQHVVEAVKKAGSRSVPDTYAQQDHSTTSAEHSQTQTQCGSVPCKECRSRVPQAAVQRADGMTAPDIYSREATMGSSRVSPSCCTVCVSLGMLVLGLGHNCGVYAPAPAYAQHTHPCT
jgi:hypothetical protein